MTRFVVGAAMGAWLVVLVSEPGLRGELATGFVTLGAVAVVVGGFVAKLLRQGRA